MVKGRRLRLKNRAKAGQASSFDRIIRQRVATLRDMPNMKLEEVREGCRMWEIKGPHTWASRMKLKNVGLIGLVSKNFLVYK